MMNILNLKNLFLVLALIVGIGIGKFIFSEPQKTTVAEEHAGHTPASGQVWTCTMHPQIRQHEPGNCPICGMKLVPVKEASKGTLNLEMSDEAVAMAAIQISKVEFSKPEKEIYMQGKVKMDERNISLISARFPGRIEKLFVDYTGVEVKKGEKLASLYSPELITAQQELLEAMKVKESNPLLYKAARNKLKLWNISEKQIVQMEKGGEPFREIDVLSPLSGIVSQRMATLGDYVKEGSKLFEVVDLSKVWIVFDAYEADIPWIKIGDKVNFKLSGVSGNSLSGKVAFIDPFINPKTRTASVRINFDNGQKQLKPEMFTEGQFIAKLPIKEAKIIVPKSAILWTGKRSVAYVKLPEFSNPTFQLREIMLGLDLGTHYIVEQGLKEGEQIVVNGIFKVDAAAQLAGKNSMMNPSGNSKPMSGHKH